MFNDYDEITIDELKGISKQLEEIKQLICVQNQLLRNNNMLLRKQIILRNDSCYTVKMPDDYSTFLNKNISIVCPYRDYAMSFAEELANIANVNLIYSKANSEKELAAEINNAKDGDIIFIDLSENIYYEKLEKILADIQDKGCINLQIGVGELVRELSLEVPSIRIVAYSIENELVPKWIKEHFIHFVL